MENEKMCESCGMPMGETNEMYGLEANGSKSVDYCKFCYDNGAFTQPDLTLAQQIEQCTDIMVKEFSFDRADALQQCQEGLPTLKRWKAAA
ncbi:MAG: zinc ribbon domain-containing protein [Oscillospiraceae bacterium]|nr:zinc ribbon domain-containing protein [Oscillospiraceae bacterium]